MLLLKNGGKVNSAPANEIDWDAMREKNRKEANTRYYIAHRFCAINKLKDSHLTFDECKKACNENLDLARKKYWDQELAIQWNETREKNLDIFGHFEEIENYFVSEETYLENAYNEPITFGLVNGSEWYERAEMGWFATTSNEKEPKELTTHYYGVNYHALKLRGF
jgi:hypothetical protein